MLLQRSDVSYVEGLNADPRVTPMVQAGEMRKMTIGDREIVASDLGMNPK